MFLALLYGIIETSSKLMTVANLHESGVMPMVNKCYPGKGDMLTVYDALMLAIAFAGLVVEILKFSQKNSRQL